MTTKDEVESFLKDFKVKMGVLSIVFRDERGKNRNALLELGITPNDRNDYLVSAGKHQVLRYARPKNAHLRKVNSAFSYITSLDPGIFSSDTEFSCKHYLQKLKASNYFKGPTENHENNMGALWEFGTDVNGSEVYVKISMGIRNKPVICISFHLAEYPIEYPFKK